MTALRVAENCRRCPDLVANRRCIVHGYGSAPTQVLFVGEAPGYKGGDLTGIPFTRDRSGVRLQQLLLSLRLSAETDPRVERPRLHCFVTNVVRCNPPANRAPTRWELASCLPYLWQELDTVQPEIVVPVGGVAAGVLFPLLLGFAAPPIGRVHARLFRTEGDGPRFVLPMRHPARSSNAELARFGAVLADVLAK